MIILQPHRRLQLRWEESGVSVFLSPWADGQLKNKEQVWAYGFGGARLEHAWNVASQRAKLEISQHIFQRSAGARQRPAPLRTKNQRGPITVTWTPSFFSRDFASGPLFLVALRTPAKGDANCSGNVAKSHSQSL